MIASEKNVLRSVQSVFVSSSGLMEKTSKTVTNCKLVLNAFCPDSVPFKTSVEEKAPFVFGYVGSMGDWFDWAVVKRLAGEIGNNKVHLIGPLLKSPPQNLPANIEIFPACSHDKLFEYLKTFNVGLIPFKKNSLTRCVDPIKFYEYYAIGLPVLTTDFGEMSLRKGLPGIYFIEDNCQINQIVEKSMQHVYDLGQIIKWRNKNTWQNRFESVGIFDDFFVQSRG
jgi:hypothetical protein